MTLKERFGVKMGDAPSLVGMADEREDIITNDKEAPWEDSVIENATKQTSDSLLRAYIQEILK